jgi:rare lipoprotein A (peptidoglycan hydrolase)
MKTKTALKQVKRTTKKASKLVAKHAKRRVLKKKQAQKLLRVFAIAVFTLSGGALVYAISTTKPTVDVSLQAKHKTKSITITPADGSISTAPVSDQAGQASWYALGLPAPDSHTCASRTYPRGTYLEVTNKRNGKTVVCLVNDYGPEAWTGRAIDLSRGSFTVIEDLGRGTLPAEIRVVPSPPVSLNFSFPDNFTAITGYALCTITHGNDYCDAHRQDPGSIK